ncbi:hypothetical protein BD779DRAFT_1471988 [Infundibulicybe gibba]|nr:hypothetical protein BD779DRAFT_1471988 [Infundibulicybe gibba]
MERPSSCCAHLITVLVVWLGLSGVLQSAFKELELAKCAKVIVRVPPLIHFSIIHGSIDLNLSVDVGRESSLQLVHGTSSGRLVDVRSRYLNVLEHDGGKCAIWKTLSNFRKPKGAGDWWPATPTNSAYPDSGAIITLRYRLSTQQRARLLETLGKRRVPGT